MADTPDQGRIDALVTKLKGSPSSNGQHPYVKNYPSSLTDEEVLDQCRKAKNAPKFVSLYDEGSTEAHNGDDSAADLALVSILARHTRDRNQIDRLFRASALYRPEKWGKRSDYREKTINKALKGLVGSHAEVPRGARVDEDSVEGNPLLAGRVDIGRVVERGIDPPEELEPDVLLKGAIHHFFGPSESGKTVLALWLIKRRVEARQRVVFFDAENGTRTIGERLKQLGADPDLLRKYLVYLPFPSLSLDARYRRAFEELLDQVDPTAIFFDSWASFLSMAGLSENENSDVEHWDTAFTKMVKKRGITSVILDHVPHEGMRSRGAARKKEVADVQWRVKKTQEFNRDVVGEVLLIQEKDREGWLPGSISFSIGGADGTLICTRSAGTVEEPDPVDGLTNNERKVYEVLQEEFGNAGARANEWQRATKERKISRATHFRAVKKLVSSDQSHEPLVRLAGETYVSSSDTGPRETRDTPENVFNKPDTQGSQEVSNWSHETCDTSAESTGITGLSPLKGETVIQTADTGWSGDTSEPTSFIQITSVDQLEESLAKFSDADLLGLDLETTGTDPKIGRIRLVQVSDGEVTVVVDAFRVDPKPLLEAIVDKTLVAHNALFELSWLKTKFELEPTNVKDTMIMSQVVYAGNIPPHEHGLGDVARRELGIELDKTAQTSDWSAETLSKEQLAYAATDAQILLGLYRKLQKKASNDA